jgi:hypothetical protein
MSENFDDLKTDVDTTSADGHTSGTTQCNKYVETNTQMDALIFSLIFSMVYTWLQNSQKYDYIE